MMPLEIFRSRQFSAANPVTFVVYAALGGFFFLLRRLPADLARLLADRRRRGIAAGDRADAPASRPARGPSRSGSAPRIPLTVGPLVIALGLLMMTRIEPGDSYVTGVLPAVVIFGAGLTLVVAPVTATVLAAADARHSGIASGVNNAVSRVGGLLAVAVLPLVAGITGDALLRPREDDRRLPHGDARLRRARRARRRPRLADDQHRRPATPRPSPGGDTPERLGEDFIVRRSPGAPLRPGREADCVPPVVSAAHD